VVDAKFQRSDSGRSNTDFGRWVAANRLAHLSNCDFSTATAFLAQWTVKMATRTQVAIIGGGPAGLLLSHMLHRNGIDSIVLERENRNHVLERIRAGVLEAGTVDLLREVGLGARMDREGHPHNGSAIAWEGRPRFLHRY
jgi:ribulose 1,5-bisphosphate synthetase/thiazole synthase